jgi:hypothetical protein
MMLMVTPSRRYVGDRAGDQVKKVETSQLMETMNIGTEENWSYQR